MMFDEMKDENRSSATGNEVFSSTIAVKKGEEKHLVLSQHTSTHRHLLYTNNNVTLFHARNNPKNKRKVPLCMDGVPPVRLQVSSKRRCVDRQ